MPLVDGHRYYPSTAVFLNELVKLTISLTMALYNIATDPKTPDTSTATGLFAELTRAVFTGDSWKMAIPGMLFTLQSSLHYVALSNLDAATFQVTDQLKILTTAVFSVMILGKSLNSRKWLSLLLLMVGVAIVQIPTGPAHSEVLSMKDLKDGTAFHEGRRIWDLEEAGHEVAQLAKRSATYEGIEEDTELTYPPMNSSLGLAAVLLSCVTSGLASVYFEKILKEHRGERSATVWVRNVQLSFYSLWPALFIGVIFWDGEHIAKTGFFAGYNSIVWTNVLVQAAGGILVSFVINYANNITKNFATSISILISFLASVIFFDMEITMLYVLGTAVVISAVYLYNQSSSSDETHTRPPQIRVPDMEKSGESGYFDLESVVAPARSPLRTTEALTSSRPTTPNIERRPPKTPDLRSAKREW
ncbi:UDP-galactose transporter Gms1 [Saxophila tyrrhenica]|uniref:UDP-galactose transporter Gms1 n=1 Tax=Saxophila tyrrhenica TaxID=1690608 RepID=A0AAV9PMS4_9PEZI|nr:UDP-galactose transporter Gms1 [Saxophila tyrrhenica]